MRKLSSTLGLLLACAFLAAGAHCEEPCKLGLIAELPVTFAPAGGVLVPVTVSGKEAWMLLAMNSGISGVFPAAVEPLGLELQRLKADARTGSHLRKDADVIKSGHKDLNNYVKFESMQLGPVPLKGFEAIVSEDGPQSLPIFRGRPIIGRIGSSLFKQFDTELDLAHGVIRIFRANHCANPPVYWASDYTTIPMTYDVAGTLTFTINLDGKKIRSSFATDTGRALLEERATSRYFGFKPDAPDLDHETMPNGRSVAIRLMSLSAAGVTVNNARVQLYARPDTLCNLGHATDGAIAYENCFNVTPFALGADLLKRLRLIIGSERNEIYVTAADGGVDQAK
jgi:hypothetical protein